MAIIVPNTESTMTTAGSVVGSNVSAGGRSGAWVWLGLVTGVGASGCVLWYRTASGVTGCELLPISLSPNSAVMFGPFNSPCGVAACPILGGSAVVWMKV